jgi:phosphatidylglycerophosphate synthase
MIEEIVKDVHPNRISFLGGVLTATGVPLLIYPETDIYGASFIALGQGIDCVDGYLARKFNERTKEGARLDPLLDKVKNLFIGGFIIANEVYQDNFLLPLTISANFVTDYVSQRARGPLYNQLEESVRAVVFPSKCERDFEEHSSQRANIYGKVKAALQNVASFGYILEELYNNHINKISEETQGSFRYLFASMLASAAVIGGIGIAKRLKAKEKSVFQIPQIVKKIPA